MIGKKVAIITGKDPLTRCDLDGGTVLTRELANGFWKKGWNIDVYTPLGFNGATKSVEKLAEQKNLTEKMPENGAKVIRFSVEYKDHGEQAGKENTFLNRIEMSEFEADYFADRKLFSYDLVLIVHMAHSFGLAKRELLPKDTTFVMPMMLGTFYSAYMEVPPEYIACEKEVLSSGVMVQTPSQAEAREITEVYGAEMKNVLVTPRGISFANIGRRLRRQCPKNPKIVCANGVRMQKGQDLLVHEALMMMRGGLKPEIHLFGINGHAHNPKYNEYAAKVKAAISENGVGQCFVFHAPVPQAELGRMINDFDLAIYPSVTETFGKSALESMASGMPTIVYDDVDAFREFMEDGKTGLIVPRKPGTIADAAKRLVSDPKLYESISRNGMKNGAENSWDAIVGRMISGFEKIIEMRKHA